MLVENYIQERLKKEKQQLVNSRQRIISRLKEQIGEDLLRELEIEIDNGPLTTVKIRSPPMSEFYYQDGIHTFFCENNIVYYSTPLNRELLLSIIYNTRDKRRFP